MAELHVQRKRRSSWWLWLIIILILAVVAYFLYTSYYQGNDSLTFLYSGVDSLPVYSITKI